MATVRRVTPWLATICVAAVGVAGCQNPPTPAAAPRPQPPAGARSAFDSDIVALVDPPPNWHADPLKRSARHTHQVWVSPTGSTAYGVIHFSLPLPASDDLVLGGFLRAMKNDEGAANLLQKTNDDQLPGLRFIAQGTVYTIRGNLVIHGWEGWVAYAGTLTKKPIDPDELAQAKSARDATQFGQPASR